MFLKNRNIISKIKISKDTDYAALTDSVNDHGQVLHVVGKFSNGQTGQIFYLHHNL